MLLKITASKRSCRIKNMLEIIEAGRARQLNAGVRVVALSALKQDNIGI
ncbi:MAG: hypothetical protein JXA25_16735 [Anaerolineales bacterium]|nr:hypothetical protein [Anaerolineales bacterium]